MSKRHPLVRKLKSGEYDGADIMEAWLLIESLQAELDKLRKALEFYARPYKEGGEEEVGKRAREALGDKP